MEKFAAFDGMFGYQWPATEQLKPYFIAPAGHEWSMSTGGDGGIFSVDGLEGTERENLPARRVNATLYITGDKRFGVTLQHDRWDGRVGQAITHFSKGDLSRCLKFGTTPNNEQLSLGLVIPFDRAWLAVEEFLTTDGGLSKQIEWVRGQDLPLGTFPEP